MKVLVTGGAGFIGSEVVRATVGRGHQVRLATRDPSRVPSALSARCEVVRVGDLGADTDWSAALRGIETVVHLAGRAHVLREISKDPAAEFNRVNALGTEKLACEAFSAEVRRVVFVSSAGVGGATSVGAPLRVSDAPQPRNAYTVSKLAGETALREAASRSGREWTVVRPPLVYGLGAVGNFRTLIRAVRRGIPLPLASVSNARSLVSVQNLASLLVACIELPAAADRTFYAAEGAISTPGIVKALAEGFGISPRLLPFPDRALEAMLTLIGRHNMFDQLCRSLVLDSTEAAVDLGWRPGNTPYEGLVLVARSYPGID